MAESNEHEFAPDEVDKLQDRVLRELDKLNERIEAVIGEFVRPRLADDAEVVAPADAVEPENNDLGDNPPDSLRKAA